MTRRQLCDLEDLLQAYEDQAVQSAREAEVYRRILMLALERLEMTTRRMAAVERRFHEDIGLSEEDAWPNP